MTLIVEPKPILPKNEFAFGQHALGKLNACQQENLSDLHGFQIFIEAQISKFSLHKLGSVYHQFPEGGFTAVVCLSESHLSVHTWPEHGFVTFDVFLSNYKYNNEEKTHQLTKAIHSFFGGELSDYSFIYR